MPKNEKKHKEESRHDGKAVLLKDGVYEKELRRLQIELVKLENGCGTRA